MDFLSHVLYRNIEKSPKRIRDDAMTSDKLSEVFLFAENQIILFFSAEIFFLVEPFDEDGFWFADKRFDQGTDILSQIKVRSVIHLLCLFECFASSNLAVGVLLVDSLLGEESLD